MDEQEETHSQETCVRISQLKHSPKEAAGCQVPVDEKKTPLKGAGKHKQSGCLGSTQNKHK